MTTKEKILETALGIFNTQGLESTSLRLIAQQMNISHGNLCYHYPNKDAIIFELFKNLVKELDAQIVGLDFEQFSLDTIYEINLNAFKITYKYRFFFLDIVNIMRKIPEIKKNYKELMKRRYFEFTFIFGELAKRGFMKIPTEDDFYKKTIKQFLIMSNFWLSDSELDYYGKEEDKVVYYAEIMFALLKPYLLV